MTTTPPNASRTPSSFLSMAFRPFFLAASLWAAFALALWIGLLTSGGALPSRFDPLDWHIHAMLFGFVYAAVAGFMLTAIANWTGRAPIHGAALAGLLGVWLAGRAVMLASALTPLWFSTFVELSFPALLVFVAGREIVAARNWRNAMMPVPIAVLGVADAFMCLGGPGSPFQAFGWRLAVAAIITLITAIGGRIIPAFTRNWRASRGAATPPAKTDLVDRIALASLHTGMLLWALLPDERYVGALLVFAAAANLWRLWRWRGVATIAEPLLAVLHLGYLWVVAGAALLGASLITPAVPLAAAIHAFTAGAIGTMVMAVMTRVSLGHTGRALRADALTTLLYAAVLAAGVTRVAAAFAPSWSMPLLQISALLWIAAFLGFACAYGPKLVSPRVIR